MNIVIINKIQSNWLKNWIFCRFISFKNLKLNQSLTFFIESCNSELFLPVTILNIFEYCKTAKYYVLYSKNYWLLGLELSMILSWNKWLIYLWIWFVAPMDLLFWTWQINFQGRKKLWWSLLMDVIVKPKFRDPRLKMCQEWHQ